METADGWFFLTREGVSVGPYESLFDAELSASLLVTRLSQLDDPAGALPMIQGYFGDPANPLARPCASRSAVVRSSSGSRHGVATSFGASMVRGARALLRQILPA